VKTYSFGFPVAATVKLTPAHAVPACPVAVRGLIVMLLEGSWDAGGQTPSGLGVPQVVVKNILLVVRTCTLSASLGVVDKFVMVNDQGKPTCPMLIGLVTVGTAPPPTPASAGPEINKKMLAVTARTVTISPFVTLLYMSRPPFDVLPDISLGPSLPQPLKVKKGFSLWLRTPLLLLE